MFRVWASLPAELRRAGADVPDQAHVPDAVRRVVRAAIERRWAVLVSRNTIAQASRFTVSLEIGPDDIPANEWLISRYGGVAETVLEWWKNDIDDEGRQWMTKRTLERLIRLHGTGLPLDIGKMYLGEGDYAPVSLTALEARLARRQVTGLRELAADLDAWAERLRAAGDEGSDATDIVHRAFANAELSQLREHAEAAALLAPMLPPKLKATYLFGADPDRQRFWTGVFMGGLRGG